MIQFIWKLIANKRPWSFYIASFLLGVVSSVALPPVGFIWVLPVIFPILLELLLPLPTKKQQFLLGWCFGYGHFIFLLSWIGNALMVEADKFAWMKPIALFGIPAILACYIGLVMVMAGFVRYSRQMTWWVFSLTWVVAELLRSYLFFPFPWNLIGYSLAPFISMSQFASVVGIYGLSWLVVLASTVIFTRSVAHIMLVCIALGAVYLWGCSSLENDNHAESFISLRLVQPNPSHHHLGNIDERTKQIRQLLLLSAKPSPTPPDAIIWPEGVLPLIGDDKILTTIADILSQKSWLLTGADRVVDNEYMRTYHNSIVSSTPNGDVAAYYDKQVLVPFGEYIPLRWLVPSFVEKIAYGMGDFTRGEGYSLIKVRDTYAVPLICYESIFSLFISNFPLAQAGFLLNVTNDDWFGDSLGPYQHLAMAKFRAIEYGRPLVRVANTGVSAVVDAHGKELASIPINTQGILDIKVDVASRKLTFYYKNMLLLGCIFIFGTIISYIAAALLVVRRKRISL